MKPDNYNSRLMKIFDMEVNFQRHKEKIAVVKNKNAAVNAKKAINSQIDLVNSFKRHWDYSESFKKKEKKRQLNKNNSFIYSHLDRQYTRKPQLSVNQALQRNLSRTLSSQRSTRSFLRSSSDLDIRRQNKRVMEKLLVVQSSLSRQNFMNQYKKTKAAKQRLQIRSTKNKERIQRSLRKMKIEPQIILPKIRSSSQTNNSHVQSTNCIGSDQQKKSKHKAISIYVKNKYANSQRKRLKDENQT